MGQRADRLDLSSNDHKTLPLSPDEAVRHLGSEIAALREDLGGLVTELDRRRHDLLDVKAQVRRHALATAAAAASLIGVVWWLARRGRARQED